MQGTSYKGKLYIIKKIYTLRGKPSDIFTQMRVQIVSKRSVREVTVTCCIVTGVNTSYSFGHSYQDYTFDLDTLRVARDMVCIEALKLINNGVNIEMEG